MSGQGVEAMPASDPRHTVDMTVQSFLRALTRRGPLLLALSGGSDSTALLTSFRAALQSSDASGFTLHAATVDHGLRSGSAAEARAAAGVAARHGVSHRVLQWHGDKPRTGLQAAARRARYRLLADEARRIGAIAVLTGHTAGDQRETIAMRLRRGAGEGLSGMAPVLLLESSVYVFRPFLDLERETLRVMLRLQGQGWIDDPSNSNLRFERARLRTEDGLPQLGASLSGLDRHAASERQAAWLSHHASVSSRVVATIAAEASEHALDDGDASTALFKLAGALGGEIFLPPLESRRRILGFLKTGNPDRRTLGGVVFDRRRQGLFLYREARGSMGVTLDPDGMTLWDGRFRLQPDDRFDVVTEAEAESLIARLAADGIPQAVGKRAIKVAPAAIFGSGSMAAPVEGDGFSTEGYRIAAHAQFLSGSELPLAGCLRHLFALPELPASPVPTACWGLLWPSTTRQKR